MSRAKINYIRKLNAYFDSLPFSVNGKSICVCLSGGADSVSLLLGLREISPKYRFELSACHFNHMIRGDESDRDEQFCRDLCDRIGITLYRGRDDVPEYAKFNKLSLEDAARKCRYAFFDRVRSRRHIDFCATAHNMNDDVETLLLNIIRGSGSNGGSSIARFACGILRPIIKISREEIIAFLKEMRQDFVIDSTNDNIEYTRNYIRGVVLPELIKINPSAVETLSRYIDSCRDDRDYFDAVVDEYMKTDLRLVHKSIRNRVIIKKYHNATGSYLNSSQINEISEAIIHQNSTVEYVNGEYEAVIKNGKVEFSKCVECDDVHYDPVLLQIGQNNLFDNSVILYFSNDIDNNTKFNKLSISEIITTDNIIGSLKIRNRRIGDKITIRGVNKSLKKLMIDKKVPKEYRNLIPIIFDDEGILYVPFVGIADRAFSKNGVNKASITTVMKTVDNERWNTAYEN